MQKISSTLAYWVFWDGMKDYYGRTCRSNLILMSCSTPSMEVILWFYQNYTASRRAHWFLAMWGHGTEVRVCCFRSQTSGRDVPILAELPWRPVLLATEGSSWKLTSTHRKLKHTHSINLIIQFLYQILTSEMQCVDHTYRAEYNPLQDFSTMWRWISVGAFTSPQTSLLQVMESMALLRDKLKPYFHKYYPHLEPQYMESLL